MTDKLRICFHAKLNAGLSCKGTMHFAVHIHFIREEIWSAVQGCMHAVIGRTYLLAKYSTDKKSQNIFSIWCILFRRKKNCSPNCTLDFYHNTYFAIFNYAKAPSSLIKIVAAIILLNIYILKMFINTGDKYNIFQMSCDKG